MYFCVDLFYVAALCRTSSHMICSKMSTWAVGPHGKMLLVCWFCVCFFVSVDLCVH